MLENNSLSLWDVLDEYADVRDEFEDLLDSFEILQDEMVMAMEDIRYNLANTRAHLERCDKVFRRYKVQKEDMPF